MKGLELGNPSSEEDIDEEPAEHVENRSEAGLLGILAGGIALLTCCCGGCFITGGDDPISETQIVSSADTSVPSGTEPAVDNHSKVSSKRLQYFRLSPDKAWERWYTEPDENGMVWVACDTEPRHSAFPRDLDDRIDYLTECCFYLRTDQHFEVIVPKGRWEEVKDFTSFLVAGRLERSTDSFLIHVDSIESGAINDPVEDPDEASTFYTNFDHGFRLYHQSMEAWQMRRHGFMEIVEKEVELHRRMKEYAAAGGEIHKIRLAGYEAAKTTPVPDHSDRP